MTPTPEDGPVSVYSPNDPSLQGPGTGIGSGFIVGVSPVALSAGNRWSDCQDA